MRLPRSAAWTPRLIAALLRGSLPSISAGSPHGERSAPEGSVPWRGDSSVQGDGGPGPAARILSLPSGAYAREHPHTRQSSHRPAPRTELSVFPWEELARIRGASPGRRLPPPGLRTTTAISGAVANAGWKLTPVDARRPTHRASASGTGSRAWSWVVWIALLGFVLYQLR